MAKETFLNLPLEKQDHILRESIKEFAKKGYHNGNIGIIAKNAGVSKGSVYQYFENKEELYMDSIKKSIEISMEYTKAPLVKYKSINIFEYIYAAFESSWPILKKEPYIIEFLQNIYYANLAPKNLPALDYILKSSRDFLLELIKANKDMGVLRQDISDESMLLFFEGVTVKFKEEMLLMAKSQKKLIYDTTFKDYESLIKDMIELLKSGIKK